MPTISSLRSKPSFTPVTMFDTSATPIPARMDGIRSRPTYTRRPGVETRTSPEIIRSLPTPYLRYTRSIPCFLSSSTRKFLMNPSSFRISAMRTLSREDGMSTFSCSARLALRTRVSMSAIGSLRIRLPALLQDARNLALERQLAEAERIVPPTVETLGRHAAKIAHAGQRDVDEAVEELVHPGSPERHLRADRHTLAQLEVRDRLLGLGDDGLLPGDRLQVGRRKVENLGVVPALAHTHVDDDLLEARHLIRVAEPALLHDRLDHGLVEELLHPGLGLAGALRPALGDRRSRRGRRSLPGLLGLRGGRRLGRCFRCRALFFCHGLSPCRSPRRTACIHEACGRRRAPWSRCATACRTARRRPGRSRAPAGSPAR